MKMFTGRQKWQGPEHPWFKRHSLSVVLTVMLITQTSYAIWSGVYVWDRERPFGDDVSALGREFWVWWSMEYNISLVADTFGVLLIVVLSKWLYEVGSSESRDPDADQSQ
jgi:hypothetical protein